MKLDPVQDQAIAARMALVVGGATFDRLFAGVRFGRGYSLRSRRTRRPREMEDNFALHISIIATDILKREVGIVLVLPKQLTP